MTHNRQNLKIKKHLNISWFFLTVIVLLFVAANALRVIPKSWAAEVTMEVYQQKDGKIFGTNTTLDIFNNPKLGSKELIAPFTTGSYSFAVHNNSNSRSLPYSLSITADNPHNVPLVFSIEKNGQFVYGGNGLSNMQLLTAFEIPESFLAGNRVDMYTLKWEWKTASDAIDTAIGNDGTQLYKLFINVTGTIEEVDPNDPPIVTDAPIYTDRPSGTASPEPTQTPEATETPESSSTPEPTETPAPTDSETTEPSETDSPQVPEPSQTDSAPSEHQDKNEERTEATAPGTIDTLPTPTKETNTLVLQEKGLYLEVNENGSPLGYWRFDTELNAWVFEALTEEEILAFESDQNRVSSNEALPQTGQLRWPIPVLTILGLLVLMLGFFIIFKNKRDENDENS